MKTKLHCLIVLFVILITSCTKELECPEGNGIEKINGFIVKWRKQIRAEQKNCIREILNNMVEVEGGTFVMGATEEQTEFARPNEYPLSYNMISSFYICKYEITDNQYIAIMGNPNGDKHLRHLSLSWSDWKQFIETLNDLSSLEFDFPTEAQWEYAARGGTKSKGFLYPGSNNVDDVRSSIENEGSKIPNELGLYNMADLKSEWCKDFYTTYENTLLYENRYIFMGKEHVVRGGNYRCTGNSGKKYLENKISIHDTFGSFRSGVPLASPYDYRYCRVSARWYYYSHSNMYIGCRLAINIFDENKRR